MSEVVFIGTSDAFGAGGRRQAAIFVRCDGGGLLLDCAPTTGTGIASLGIARDEIDAIAVSHFHGDHFAGIPLLVLASHYEDHRTQPLVIAGPPGVEARVRAVGEAFAQSLDRELSFPLRFVELAAGEPADLGPARIEAFAAHHHPDTHPHGLIATEGAQRVVYTGDTGWFDALPAAARRADLFACECTFHELDFDYHLNYRTLRERAPEFDCERMIVTHLGEEMARRRGRLELETADDGLRVEL